MAVNVQTPILPRTVAGKQRTQNVLSGANRGDQVLRDNLINVNQSIRDLRTNTDLTALLRTLYSLDGLVSTAISSMVRLADSGYRIAAFATGTHEFSEDGFAAASSVIASIDTVFDYTAGYADKPPLGQVIEQALLEVALTSGVGCELVLTPQKTPEKIVLFPYDTVIWKGDGKSGRYPSQRLANPTGSKTEIDLTIPTVWVAEAMKPADVVYGTSIFGAGLSKLFLYDEFIEDMRRVIRQSGQPRLDIKLNYEAVVNSAPAATQQDPEKLSAYLESWRESFETIVADLAPEDALVYFDMAEVTTHDTKGEKKDYKDLLDTLSGLAASALKSNPSILGLRLGGSQNVASTETMLFTHMARTLQGPVEQLLSRALTLAVRLYGIDVYVKFIFEEVDLRPKHELEAYFQIRQQRVLELLSLGFYTEAEAAAILRTGPRSPNAPDLSGTMFYKADASAQPSPNEDPNGRSLSPDTPTSAGGRDNAQRPGRA